MTIQSNFRPKYGSTQIASPAASSATITLGTDSRTVRVKNTGATNPMFFRMARLLDAGTVTATTADMPVYPGEVVYIERDPRHDTLAYISASGTTMAVTLGEGGVGSGN